MPDQWNTMPARGVSRFVGRDAESAELRTAVLRNRTVAVCGDGGAGKTALAMTVFTHLRDSDTRFTAAANMPGHGVEEGSLLDTIYRHVADRPVPVPDVALLPDMILDALQGQETDALLLLIDNVEEFVATGQHFNRLLDLLQEQPAMTLIFTTRHRSGQLRAETSMNLGGLRDDASILELVGPELVQRFGEGRVLDTARQIGALPQRLLYFRWASPADPDEFARSLLDEPELASIDAVRLVLGRITGKDVLIACGLLRDIALPLELIHYLCDRLGVGVDDVIVGAVAEQVLFSPSAAAGQTYHVHPFVHLDLSRIAEENGRRWARLIHEWSVEYYGSALRVNSLDTDAFSEYIHHLLMRSDVSQAYRAIGAAGLIDRWRRAGLAVHMQGPLDEIFLASESAPGILTAHERATLDLHRAHINSDLGKPRECLRLLEESRARLQAADDIDARDIIRRTYVQAAISHGNIGDIDDCIASYQRAIDADKQAANPETAACMGYVGYHYCDLLEFDSAQKWSDLALRVCPMEVDAAIFARNLCNRALVAYYSGDVSEARVHLEQAEALLSDSSSPAYDLRELGRVYLHLSLVYLALPDVPLTRVGATLSEAQRLSSTSGDSRRAAIGIAREGLVAAHEGNFGQADQRLKEAAQAQLRVGDKRSLAMTLLIWTALDEVRRLSTVPAELPSVAAAVERFECLGSADFGGRLASSLLSSTDGQRLLRVWNERHRWLYFGRLQNGPLPQWLSTR